MLPDRTLLIRTGFLAMVGILAAILLLLFKPVWLTGRTIYETRFADIGLLRSGADVRWRGFVVGRVRGIETDFATRTSRVWVSLEGDFHPGADAVLQIDDSNPIRSADMALISPDQCDGPVSTVDRPNSLPSCGRKAGLLDVANEVAGEALIAVRRIGALVEQVQGDMNSPGDGKVSVVQRAENVIANLETVSAQLSILLNSENTEAARTLLAESAGVASEARDLLAEVNGTVLPQVSGNLTGTARELSSLIASADQLIRETSPAAADSMGELRFLLATTADRMDRMAANLEQLTANLNDLLLGVRDDPGMLIRGKSYNDPIPTR